MKRLILVVAALVVVSSCNTPNNATDNFAKYPKDPNITKDTCIDAGEACHIPPGEEATDKCCEGLAPVPFSTSQDGSTGYSHYRCIYSDKCTGEDQKAEYNNNIACCSGLIIMNDKCVGKDKCSSEKEQILVGGPLNQKKCIEFPDCIKSGSFNKNICEYCCPGSKYTTQAMTGIPPKKCLGPDENLTEEEVKYQWSEPKIITQEDFDAFKTKCLDDYHP